MFLGKLRGENGSFEFLKLKNGFLNGKTGDKLRITNVELRILEGEAVELREIRRNTKGPFDCAQDKMGGGRGLLGVEIDSGTRVVGVLGVFSCWKTKILGDFFAFLRVFTHFFVKMTRNWPMFWGGTRVFD